MAAEKIGTFEHDPNVLPDTTPLPRPVLDGIVEPKISDVILCSYPDTVDGFAAAWVVYQIAKRDNLPLEFVKGADFTPEAKEILERNWIAISDRLPPISTYGKGLLTVSRLHDFSGPFAPIPYKFWKRTMPFGIDRVSSIGKVCGVYDKKKSLCLLTWEFFCADRVGFEQPPKLIAHIDDYVTGANKYRDSKDIYVAVSTYPREFRLYSALAKACDDRRRREAMIAAGQGIARYMATQGQQ